MNLVNLSTDLVTGIAAIDAQHAALINAVNKFYEDVLNCSTIEEEKALSGAFLLEFVEYAQKHFTYEEELLLAMSYPEFHEHQQEHDNFKRKLLHLKAEYLKNGYALSFELLSFIREWVANHLDDSDKAYATYLKQTKFKRD